MNRCPITFDACGESQYSSAGLHQLSPRLTDLKDFPYSAAEQRREAVIRAGKLSIQGVQPKLSAVLKTADAELRLQDTGGRYIIKPPHDTFPHLPENEALTMRMAAVTGIEVPFHGLIHCKDGSLSYIVRRFDRGPRHKKLAVEDFTQLGGYSRDTKYDGSMEKVAKLIAQYCTFPAVENVKLLRRSLFNFLVGNEDMHLKNFSVIVRNGKVELAPAYDLLSTTVAYMALGKPLNDIEELALPLNGKKRGVTSRMWRHYFGEEHLGLPNVVVDKVVNELIQVRSAWEHLIATSFLSADEQAIYLGILEERFSRL